MKNYRDPKSLQAAIPRADRLISLTRTPFVGQLAYRYIARVLDRQARWLTRAERLVVVGLTAYLELKLYQSV